MTRTLYALLLLFSSGVAYAQQQPWPRLDMPWKCDEEHPCGGPAFSCDPGYMPRFGQAGTAICERVEITLAPGSGTFTAVPMPNCPPDSEPMLRASDTNKWICAREVKDAIR